MLPAITFTEQWGYVKATWRLLLLFGIAQVVGGVYSLLSSNCPSAFGAFWYGGALATPVGFLLGLAWQWLREPASVKANLSVVLVLGAGAVVLPVAALSEAFSFICTFQVRV